MLNEGSGHILMRDDLLPNVEVTGDPLEAACGAGMFVI